jgi:hypothetical protein
MKVIHIPFIACLKLFFREHLVFLGLMCIICEIQHSQGEGTVEALDNF